MVLDPEVPPGAGDVSPFVIKTSQVFWFEVDDKLTITDAASSVLEACGYRPDEVVGKHFECLLADQDSRQTVRKQFRALASGEVCDSAFLVTVRHKLGSPLTLAIFCRRSSCGSIQGLALDVNAGADPQARRRTCDMAALCARGEDPVRTDCWEEVLRDKSGRPHWLLWQDAKGPCDLLIGVGQEITDHKSMGDALVRSTRRSRAIFDNALDAMTLTDNEFRYVDVNRAACELLGRPREQIIGAEVGGFSRNGAELRRLYTEAVRKGSWVGEIQAELINGTPRQIESTVTANILPGLHLIVLRDLTQRKLLEQQLLQSQKMEAIGQLAGGVAHDFNNMLTVIRGYCELLQRKLQPESDLRRYADNIVSAADKATMTTQQLLAFSRRQVIQPRKINLNSVVQDVGKLLQKLIGEDIQLRIAPASDLGLVKADPGQMAQVLLNLAVNARDAMPNGGALTIESANVELDETYARTHLKVDPGHYVMLTVTDTGCGMDSVTLTRIFEPFFTTKDSGKGTGLGLSTVYGIVEQASGAIYVYSEPGEGTSFKIYLPRVGGGELADAEKIELAAGDATVLLLDDDFQWCSLAKEFLGNHGYRVLTASSGSEALQVCRKHTGRLDLIVSDVTMPGTDGQDIQGYLAVHHPESRVVYISGFTRKTLRDRGVLPRDAVFLQKPFRMDDLRSLLEEVLGDDCDDLQG